MVAYVAETLTPLSGDVVRRRLARFADWSGDEHRISRTLERPTDTVRLHLQRVLDLSPYGGDLHEDDGRLVITLHTEAAGGVTAYDIALAQRIDDVLIDARLENLAQDDGDIHGDHRRHETVEVGYAHSTQSGGRP